MFTDAMALTPAGDGVYGVYGGELNEHWTIGPKVHGGAMLALCANAALRNMAKRQSSRSQWQAISCVRPDEGGGHRA